MDAFCQEHRELIIIIHYSYCDLIIHSIRNFLYDVIAMSLLHDQ